MIKNVVFIVLCWLGLGLGVNTSYAQNVDAYAVDTEQSYVHIYTGTSGVLKAISHKHLIAIRDISGEILLDGANSIAHLSMRPDLFLMDADEERSLAVDDAYQDPVAGWIQTGTMRNMNGAKLLDAESYPEITLLIHSNNLSDTPVFSVVVTLKNIEYEFDVQGSLIIAEGQVQASGDFSITHASLGLKRFSVPGGLSKVADSLRFVFDIKAQLIE